jgi:hypothetical protein
MIEILTPLPKTNRTFAIEDALFDLGIRYKLVESNHIGLQVAAYHYSEDELFPNGKLDVDMLKKIFMVS